MTLCLPGIGRTVLLRRLAALAAACLAASGAQAATEMPLGKASGLPVPRYVSLKTDRVNLREGPSKDHRTAWVFQRAGLPVEITAEHETWRRIRDAEGTEGWVLHSLLSGRRTALVMPWAKTGTDACRGAGSTDAGNGRTSAGPASSASGATAPSPYGPET